MRCRIGEIIESGIALGLDRVEQIVVPQPPGVLREMVRAEIPARDEPVEIDRHARRKVDHVQRIEIVRRQRSTTDLKRQLALNVGIGDLRAIVLRLDLHLAEIAAAPDRLARAAVSVHAFVVARAVLSHLIHVGAVHDGGGEDGNPVNRLLVDRIAPDDGDDLHVRKHRTAVII